MTEKLLTGTLNLNTNKKNNNFSAMSLLRLILGINYYGESICLNYCQLVCKPKKESDLLPLGHQSLSTYKSSRAFSSITKTELSVFRFLGKSYSQSSPCNLILVFLLISLICLFQSRNSCSELVPSHWLLLLLFLFFYSVLRPFQDYFSSYDTGESVGGAKTGEL